MPRLITRNPLTFPTGVTPGFNPNHPAAIRPNSSFIPGGGNFINLLKGGARGVPSGSGGAPSAVLEGALGPGVKFGTTLNQYITHTVPAQGNGSVTMAAIVRINTTANSALIMQNVTGAAGSSLYFMAGGHFSWFWGNATGEDWCGLNYAANVPYFVVATMYVPLGTANEWMGMTNLLTGQVQIGTSGLKRVANAGCTGTVYIGGQDVNNQSFDGTIAAVMYSDSYLTPQDMAQWCADPWSYWYPDV